MTEDYEVLPMKYYANSIARTLLIRLSDARAWEIHTFTCPRVSCAKVHTQISPVFDSEYPDPNNLCPPGLDVGWPQYEENSKDVDAGALTHDRVIEQFRAGGILLEQLYNDN